MRNLDKEFARAKCSEYSESTLFKDATHSRLPPVSSNLTVIKCEEDKVVKENDFLPDLDDPTAISLNQQLFEEDYHYENELLSSHINKAIKNFR